MVWTYIRMGFFGFAVVKDIGTTNTRPGYKIVPSFGSFAIHYQTHLAIDVKRITSATRNDRFCVETSGVGHSNVFTSIRHQNTAISKISGRNIPNPAVFAVVEFNRIPAMVFVGFRQIGRFEKYIFHPNFGNSTFKSVLVYFATAIFFVHRHNNRIVDNEFISFNFSNGPFKIQIIVAGFPLFCSRTSLNLIHFQLFYPALGTWAVNNNLIANFKVLCITNRK